MQSWFPREEGNQKLVHEHFYSQINKYVLDIH